VKKHDHRRYSLAIGFAHCDDPKMNLSEVAAVDVRPLLRTERDDLLALLDGMTEAEWLMPTAVPGWTVKDLALHLLDDDLGWLSRGRDEDSSGLLDPSDYRSFVEALAAKNQRWVDGAQGLSRRVVADLLRCTGEQLDAYYAELDLEGSGGVIWASDGPVPVWFDIAQDLTERWVHQQQMREAIDRLEDYARRYLPTVLRTFVWAVPHQYRVTAPLGTEVEITLGDTGTWTLSAVEDSCWSLGEGRPGTRPLGSA
jgi:uncharacterized protein (TIGR03083 family)